MQISCAETDLILMVSTIAKLYFYQRLQLSVVLTVPDYLAVKAEVESALMMMIHNTDLANIFN